MNRLKNIAEMIIDATEKCEPLMPWMLEVTEEEFATTANAKIEDLLKIANSLV